MAVIPKRPVLPHVELISERFSRFYPIEADARHTIHARVKNHPVPMDGRVVSEVVRNSQCYTIALTPAQDWPRHRAVDCRCGSLPSGEIYHLVADVDVETRTAQSGNRLSSQGHGKRRISRNSKTEQRAAGSRSSHKAPARHQCRSSWQDHLPLIFHQFLSKPN